MASVVDKQLSDGSKAYLVRFRTAEGKQRSKQFQRRRDALAFANVTEVDRQHGTLVDPRLGRITVGEWWDQWWPTVTNLHPSTKARDEQFFRTHAAPCSDRPRSASSTEPRFVPGSPTSGRPTAATSHRPLSTAWCSS